MTKESFLSSMSMLQRIYPTHQFDLEIYWDMFSDIEDGEVFLKSMSLLMRSWKQPHHPPIGVIRENYLDLLKTASKEPAKIENNQRWEEPPAEWIALKKKLGLRI